MLNVTEYKKSSSPNTLPVTNTVLSPKYYENELHILNDKEFSSIKDTCINNVPFWNTLDYDDIEIFHIPTAFTNSSFIVKLIHDKRDTFPLNHLLVKKRIRFDSILCDHDSQYHVAKTLGDNKCGPKILGCFGDYIIQEFVEGSTLKVESLHNLSVVTGLASSLAKFHKKGTEIAPSDWDRTPFVLRQITKWSQHAERVIKKYNLEFDFNELTASFELFKKLLENHVQSSNSPANSIMFCHNDLLYKNVLVNNHGLYLIDFDYAGFNYVGCDIATLLSRMCLVYNTPTFPFFTHDESLEYSYELKTIFVSVYLSRLTNKNILANDPAVKEFIDSLEIHLLGAHLFWTYWSLIMIEELLTESLIVFSVSEYTNIYYNEFKSQLEKLNVSNM